MTPAEVIRRAEDLELSDWSAALELLEASNRSARSDEVEIALAQLRHRCFERLVSTLPGSEPAEPPLGGPAIGASGLPECGPVGLTAAQVRAALVEHGCLLVRRAVDAGGAHALAEGIDRSFAAQELADDTAAPSAWWSPLPLDAGLTNSLGRKWVRGGGGVLLADSPRLLQETLDIYTAIGLRAVATDYLGSRPVLSANKCTLRRVAPTANGDWHQDGAFLGRGIRAINFWLTLTPCGVDAPGLDVVPRRFDEVVATGTGGAYFDWAVGPAVVERVAEESGVLRPAFDAGDLLIFDDLFLHRTAVEPEMTKARHAVEMWCFASDAYPGGQVPLVW